MARIYKKHGSSFKGKVALEALRERKTHAELCQEFGVSSTQISTWKKQLEEEATKIFEGKQQKSDQKSEIERLHRIIGQLTVERDFLERVLNH
jgi:transposase